MAPIKAFRSRREGRKPALLASVLGALALGGCSMPIAGFIDRAPTGAIKSSNYPFAQDDWAKAEPAVLAAIRADAADDPASWSNAASGRNGAIVGVGSRFSRGPATCRAFVARIRDGEDREVQGAACEKDGQVTISDAGPFRGI